jgi:hypothetical protein
MELKDQQSSGLLSYFYNKCCYFALKFITGIQNLEINKYFFLNRSEELIKKLIIGSKHTRHHSTAGNGVYKIKIKIFCNSLYRITVTVH